MEIWCEQCEDELLSQFWIAILHDVNPHALCESRLAAHWESITLPQSLVQLYQMTCTEI